jgi:hypothetical protein
MTVVRDTLPDSPSVRIKFDGLMALCFDRRRTLCQAGVLAKAPKHVLDCKIARTAGGETAELETPKGLRKGDIRLSFPKHASGVSVYQNGAFVGCSDVDDTQDFRWVVDLEGPDFHNRAMKIKPKAFSRLITLNGGVFYNFQLSDVAIDIKRAATGEVVRRRKVSTVTGANVYLEPGDSFTLRFGEDGKGRKTFKAEKDVTWEFTFDYLCPAAKSDQPNLESDFPLYYRAFQVDKAEQFDLDLNPRDRERIQKLIEEGGDVSGFSSHRIPCDNVFLSQTYSLS